jgi:hypothetical protein
MRESAAVPRAAMSCIWRTLVPSVRFLLLPRLQVRVAGDRSHVKRSRANYSSCLLIRYACSGWGTTAAVHCHCHCRCLPPANAPFMFELPPCVSRRGQVHCKHSATESLGEHGCKTARHMRCCCYGSWAARNHTWQPCRVAAPDVHAEPNACAGLCEALKCCRRPIVLCTALCHRPACLDTVYPSVTP